MLEALHLWKFYGGTAAVRDVSFVVGAGEIVGYLGANGSGKSTTARMVTGLLTPSRGVVTFKGRDIAEDLVAYRQRLGYVPEEPALYGYLSGREYLEFVAQLRALPDSVVTEKVPALLRLFGIADAAELDISGYSKGMKQKVLLIAALLHDPDVLVLDEPESGLDVTAALVMRHLVTALARQGKAILYSSHVLDSVERLCTRVIVLQQGACVATGTSQELRTLMSQPTLEDVFAQLVLRQDPGEHGARHRRRRDGTWPDMQAQTRLLVRHFVRGYASTDLAGGERQAALSAALLFSPSLFIIVVLSSKYVMTPFPAPGHSRPGRVRRSPADLRRIHGHHGVGGDRAVGSVVGRCARCGHSRCPAASSRPDRAGQVDGDGPVCRRGRLTAQWHPEPDLPDRVGRPARSQLAPRPAAHDAAADDRRALGPPRLPRRADGA